MPNIDDNTIGQNEGRQLRHSSTKIHVELYKQLLGHKQGIYCAIETQKGIFTAGGDGAIVCWTWEQLAQSSEPIGQLWASIPEPVFCMLMVNEETLLAGTQKGNLYRLTPGKPPQAIAVDSQSIYFVRWWQDFFWIGTGSGQLMIMDNEFCLIKALPISTKSLRCMDSMDDLAWIGCSDAHVYRLKFIQSVASCTDESADLLAVLQTKPNIESDLSNTYALPRVGPSRESKLEVSRHLANEPSVFGVKAIDKNALISVGRDAHVRLFQDSQLISSVPAHLGTIHGLSKHPILPWFATGSMDKSIKLWQWEIGSDLSTSMHLIKVINREKFAGEVGHTHSVNSVIWISEEGKKSLREKQNAENFAQDPSQVHWLLSVGDDRHGILWGITQFC